MKLEESIYNQKSSRIAKERIRPRLSHPRYVHLKLILNHILYWIDKYLRNNKEIILADMGCGEVPYKHLIERHVQKYIGIDLPGNKHATSYVDLKTGRSTLNNNHCDIVWSIQVLSNTPNPQEYLKECYRILKPGGLILLSTHGHWPYRPDPFDYGRWTSYGIKFELEKHGFKIIDIEGMMGILSTSLQLLQDAILLSIPFNMLYLVSVIIFPICKS